MSLRLQQVFLNGISIGTGGGYTVGREVLRHLALARPDTRFVMGVLKGHPLHETLHHESLPDNAELFWAPESARGLTKRSAYERGELAPWVEGEGFNAVLQLNGMMVPGMKPPTLAHFQDPFPFRREAWHTLRERVVAAFKRRAFRYALQNAAACGWTSHYLQQLICGKLGLEPKQSIVFYNGVPEEWIDRATQPLPDWDTRPMKLVTVSDVQPYKRQSLVIEALPRLRQTPGLEQLEYHILGNCRDTYRDQLIRLANQLGVGDAVHVEGRVSDERVQQALSQARVMPLMSVCESFGIPPVEAMTYGTPVVIADCCALPEVCTDAAIKCPVDDLDALVNAIRQVLTSPETAQRLREAGAHRAQDFRWSTIGQRMAECLEEIAA